MLTTRLMMNTIASCSMAAFLASCGAGRVTVLDAITDNESKFSFNVKSSKHSVEVPKETIERFETRLHKKLFEEGVLVAGKDITINYRFIQYDEGSRLARYMLGGLGNSGEGSLSIEFVFVKTNGTQIGKIHAEGRIGSGMFGGSIDSAIDAAVEAVVEFAKKTFK